MNSDSSTTPQVIVIGGGFAGLAAAAALAERGVRATVLEGRPRLGGRAYSFTDAETGLSIDNGQHALMGCYHETLAFLRRIGAADKLRRQPDLRVDLADPVDGHGSIAAAALPPPLHVAAALLRYRLLSRLDRLRTLFGGLRLLAWNRRADTPLLEWTVADAMDALGQSPAARARFWYPLAIATLNEAPERASAQCLAVVLARAFFGRRTDGQFLLSRVGLSDLYTGDAQAFIEKRGGRVCVDQTAAAIVASGGRAAAVALRGGGILQADAVIAAVPPAALAPLLPAAFRRGRLSALESFETSPIVSAHLLLDPPVLQHDFLGLLGTTTQWVFNRSRLAAADRDTARASAAEGAEHLSAVISAARDVVEWDAARIIDTVIADLRGAVPAARQARVRWARVVKEKRATIAPTPANERRRPGVETELENLLLAGDWIATGLPPTIESAVASAHRAADLAAAQIRAQSRAAMAS